jgi:hypothetical protein
MTDSLAFPLRAGSALPAFSLADCVWHGEQRAGDRLLLRLGRQGALYVAEDTRYGTLVAAPDGQSHRFDPHADADPTLVEKFVASLVRALVRQLQGKLSLHGSVVAFDGRGAAFVGSAFAGKSTFAQACVQFAHAELLADDTVAFVDAPGPPEVEPVQRGTWLLSESRAFFGLHETLERKVLAPSEVATSARPLRAVFLLTNADAEEPSLRRLSGLEAFQRVVPHVFRFAHDDASLRRRELDMLADVLPQLEVHELRRRRDFATLAAQVQLVSERVRALAPR